VSTRSPELEALAGKGKKDPEPGPKVRTRLCTGLPTAGHSEQTTAPTRGPSTPVLPTHSQNTYTMAPLKNRTPPPKETSHTTGLGEPGLFKKGLYGPG
jgi:hypothetical protein